MAIAGLHNVPLLESSLLRESQSSSSGRRSNQGSVSTRASSILQMWRELEDECAVSRARERGRPRLHQIGNDGLAACREGEGRSGLEESSESENGSAINSESHVEPLIEQDDRQSMTSEQSQDLGEVERERVRKIFREWMSSGGNIESPREANVNRSPRAQCCGENEHERVRIVTDWIQMNSQQREVCNGNRETHVTETGSQIEQFREGQVLEHNEGRPENSRRQIRKLCGRQALLDLLAKKDLERRQELQCLVGTRPVSGFAHRNRIQSLLRLRCFQNMRSVELSRPSSARESELGLLRQRQTVSGLREGFLSRLDNNIHVQASDLSNSPSDNDEDALREVQTHANTANEDVDSSHERIDPANVVINGSHEQNDSALVMHYGAREQKDPEGDVGVGPSTSLPSIEPNVGALVDSNQPMEFFTGNLRQCDSQVEARLCHDMDNAVEGGPETLASLHSIDSSEDGSPRINFDELLRRQSGELSVEEVSENFHEHATGIEEIDVHSGLDDQLPTSQNINGHESSVVVDDWPEQVSEYQRDWEGSAISNQWRDFPVETNGTHLAVDDVDVSHGALESEGGDQNDAQEDYWHDNGSHETPRDWLEMVSGSRLPSDRVDTYYYSDDDNVYHIELRELVNRRRVSSLLHSDFRESLDQLIQSYVERQTNAPDDWELNEMLPPPFLPRNQESSDVDQDESGSDDILTGGREESLPTPPPPPPPPQRHWGQGLHQTNWGRRETRQRPGTEWEIINDLRIDMAKLAQRLNNMQRMLEACMDMQLELQRSVRQEVSAALNRSVNPSETLENLLPKDSFKWDCVRKGVCCICSNSTINSLLYRCGHMCTCTKCADVLVQGNGKCPMCQAPVIEVIRAYFIQ